MSGFMKASFITIKDQFTNRADSLQVEQNQDKSKEALSALMDGESDELELRRVLREAPSNPELVATWRRYHAIQASLQQSIHGKPSVNLLDGIKARLADEDGQSSLPVSARVTGKVLRSGLLRYLGQGAIAASVAVAALMGVSLLETAQNGTSEAAVIAAGAPVETPALGGDFNASELARTAVTDAEAYSRLERAVLQEFSDLPAPEEIPVNYNPDFPVQPVAAE
jgi:sigma-E factor negative regulatory protein RseA